MRIFTFILLSMLTAFANANSEVYIIQKFELALGGIIIGQSGKKTISMLGEPESKLNNGEGIVYVYKGISIIHGVPPYGVYDIKSTSDKFCTPSKACPGMTLEQIISIYGKPLKVERHYGMFYEYLAHDSTCWLQLKETNNVVKSISIVCAP